MPVRFCFIALQPSNWAPYFSAHPAAFSLSSPTPANPCVFVSGSKIFTFPPPNFAQALRRPRIENGLKLGAKETEDQGFAVVRAPSPRRPRVENGLKLGAKETEEQGFAVVRAPSLCHPAAQAQRARNLTLPTARRRLSPRIRKKHRAAQSLLGAFLSSLSIIPIPLLPPAQS